MGNRHSTDQGETAVSGVSLSQDLQEDIVRDFQNKTIQDQWNIFRASVLSRRHERHSQLLQAAQAIQVQQSAKTTQAAERNQHLDNALDRMNAQFADELVAANYDADAALSKYSPTESTTTSEAAQVSPCLGPRAHWMFCAQKYLQDNRPCDAYLAVLEKCVHDAIVNKTLKKEGE